MHRPPMYIVWHNVKFWKTSSSTLSLVHWQKYICYYMLEMQFFEEWGQKGTWEWLDIFKELCNTASQKVGWMSALWVLSLSRGGKCFGFNICSSVCGESDKLLYDCMKTGWQRVWRRQITIHKIGRERIMF